MSKKDPIKIELSFDDIGSQIRSARKINKMNLKDFRCMSYTQLSKIECGIAKVTTEQIRQVFSEMFPGQELEISFK